jgi:hypothetical protein
MLEVVAVLSGKSSVVTRARDEELNNGEKRQGNTIVGGDIIPGT